MKVLIVHPDDGERKALSTAITDLGHSVSGAFAELPRDAAAFAEGVEMLVVEASILEASTARLAGSLPLACVPVGREKAARTIAGMPLLRLPTSPDALTHALEAARPLHRLSREYDSVLAWLGGLLALSTDALIATDAAGVIRLVNDAARGLFGPETPQPIGLPIDVSLTLHETGREGRLALSKLDDGMLAQGVSAVLVQPGAASVPVRVFRLPVGPEWRPMGHIVRLEDLRERHLRDDAARRAREQDGHSQAREAVTLFMSGVGNQLRNAVQIITGHAELIAEGVASPKARRASAESIRRTSKRVFGLIARMLEFAQTSAEPTQVIDAADCLIESSAALRSDLPERIDLVTRLPAQPCPIAVDPAALDKVLRALIENARDAMPAGGTIHVIVDRVGPDGAFPGDAAPIASSAPRSDGETRTFVALRVKDAGTGIPPDVREHLFEPFFTTKRETGGTGLGLSHAADVAARAGGRVEVASEIGRGTTVTVLLPVAADAPVARPVTAVSRSPVKTPEPAPSPVSGRTILVVEDEPDLLLLTTETLEGLGHTVIPAELGSAALTKAAAHPGTIDLLLTDVMMPGMRGPQVADELQKLRPGIKIVYMTGDLNARSGLLPPGSLVVEKPFTLKELSVAVSRALADLH